MANIGFSDPIIYDQVYFKRLCRFFILRDFLLTENTSGLYRLSSSLIWKASKATGICYNTIKKDLSLFASYRLITWANGFIKLNKITYFTEREQSLYKKFRNEIKRSHKPPLYFSDLYKRKVIFSNVVKQSFKEAEKINDERLKVKYRASIRRSKAVIGANKGIRLSIKTISKILNKKSPSSGFRYVASMNKNRIVTRIKRRATVPAAQKIEHLKNQEGFRGRLFFENGELVERLQNDYIF